MKKKEAVEIVSKIVSEEKRGCGNSLEDCQ